MWQIVVPSALVAAVTLYGLLLNRDPYHRLRKALDIYKDLPEPFDEAWKKAVLRSELLAARKTTGLSVTSALVPVAGLAVFLVVSFLWAIGTLGKLDTVESIIFGLMMGLLLTTSVAAIWLLWVNRGNRPLSMAESLDEADRAATSEESVGPES